jgi:hypothetical protein
MSSQWREEGEKRTGYLLNDEEFDGLIVGVVTFQSIRVSHHILANATVIFFSEDSGGGISMTMHTIRSILKGRRGGGMRREKSSQILSRSHHHLND